MKWVDAAELTKRLHPDTSPEFGVNFVSLNLRWRVGRNDTTDPSKGWGIWCMAGRPLQIAERVPLATAEQAMALADLLDLPIRGLAFALRVRRGWRTLLGVTRGMNSRARADEAEAEQRLET